MILYKVIKIPSEIDSKKHFMCFNKNYMSLVTTIRYKSDLFHSKQLLSFMLSVMTGCKNILLLLLSPLLTGKMQIRKNGLDFILISLKSTKRPRIYLN